MAIYEWEKDYQRRIWETLDGISQQLAEYKTRLPAPPTPSAPPPDLDCYTWVDRHQAKRWAIVAQWQEPVDLPNPGVSADFTHCRRGTYPIPEDCN